jgi:hypothetical protein
MSESVQARPSLQNWQVPEGLVLHQMSDPARRFNYFLAFKQVHSDYDSWIKLLGHSRKQFSGWISIEAF